MKLKITLVAAVLLSLAIMLSAAPPRKRETPNSPAAYRSTEPDAMRIEGEQRFRANCGRCHAAPQKFPPRMMATIVRHMRVRATITDDDMRLVLFYMTQ